MQSISTSFKYLGTRRQKKLIDIAINVAWEREARRGSPSPLPQLFGKTNNLLSSFETIARFKFQLCSLLPAHSSLSKLIHARF